MFGGYANTTKISLDSCMIKNRKVCANLRQEGEGLLLSLLGKSQLFTVFFSPYKDINEKFAISVDEYQGPRLV